MNHTLTAFTSGAIAGIIPAENFMGATDTLLLAAIFIGKAVLGGAISIGLNMAHDAFKKRKNNP